MEVCCRALIRGQGKGSRAEGSILPCPVTGICLIIFIHFLKTHILAFAMLPDTLPLQYSRLEHCGLQPSASWSQATGTEVLLMT